MKNTKSSQGKTPKKYKNKLFFVEIVKSYFYQNQFLKQIDRNRAKTYSEILPVQNLRGLAQSGHFWSFLVATSSVTIKVSKLKSEYVLRSSKVVNFLRVVLVVQFQITWFYMFLIFLRKMIVSYHVVIFTGWWLVSSTFFAADSRIFPNGFFIFTWHEIQVTLLHQSAGTTYHEPFSAITWYDNDVITW